MKVRNRFLNTYILVVCMVWCMHSCTIVNVGAIEYFYILPYSSIDNVVEADIEKLTLQELNYARNEIYARHGRKFKSKELTSYFNSKSWYHGTIEPDQFDDLAYLSEVELTNVKFLYSYEHQLSPNGYQLDQALPKTGSVLMLDETVFENKMSEIIYKYDLKETMKDFGGFTDVVYTIAGNTTGSYLAGELNNEFDELVTVRIQDTDISYCGITYGMTPEEINNILISEGWSGRSEGMYGSYSKWIYEMYIEYENNKAVWIMGQIFR